jgi:hypothetical protein
MKSIYCTAGIVGLLQAWAISGSSAYHVDPPADSSYSRRQMLFNTLSATTIIGTGWTSKPSRTEAIEACARNSNNCIRTTWIPPLGTSKSEMGKAVVSAIEAYPQTGQADVDRGGWLLAEDNGLSTGGTARYEFRTGTDKIAKFLNGGKPFIDDLVVEITDGAVEVRSASRIGDSDLGVNAKRLSFLGEQLKAAGWTIPDPKY